MTKGSQEQISLSGGGGAKKKKYPKRENRWRPHEDWIRGRSKEGRQQDGGHNKKGKNVE